MRLEGDGRGGRIFNWICWGWGSDGGDGDGGGCMLIIVT